MPHKVSQGSAATYILGDMVGNVTHYFVANLTDMPAVKNKIN